VRRQSRGGTSGRKCSITQRDDILIIREGRTRHLLGKKYHQRKRRKGHSRPVLHRGCGERREGLGGGVFMHGGERQGRKKG